MSTARWEDFIDNLKDDAGILAKDELKTLIKTVRNDSEDFIKKQGEKMERYLDQLAEGEITRAQFEGYVMDIKDLTEMQALKMSVAAKVRAQNLAQGMSDLVIKGLLTLI
ncbi:MAG: hypothetical protein AAB296_08835 [Candidatus Desantisbacteria bacterium]